MNVPCYVVVTKALSLSSPLSPDKMGVSNQLQVPFPALRPPHLSLLGGKDFRSLEKKTWL